MADVFSTDGTIGIEEEFYAVDPDTLMPAPASEDLLEDPPAPLTGHMGVELFKCVIEANSRVIDDIDEVPEELERRRGTLRDHAGAHGYDILAAGLHPAARWRELAHVERPRYAEQLERIQYPQHRNLTAGLHVHIGMDDADAAVTVADRLRSYLPLLLALSANSPFWNGHDTGLQSARALIFENLPTTGIPTAFDSWQDFKAFERRMLETDSIADRGAIWWDVRPHSGYGTVEVRIMDAQADEARVAAFVRIVHALVTFLQDHEPAVQRHEFLEENKWRAIRYGQGASLIRPDTTVPVEKWAYTVADRIGADQDDVDTLLDEHPAARQRERYERDGFDAVMELLRC